MVAEQLTSPASMQQVSVKTLVNFPVSSNCYILRKSGTNSCIIVDPACGPGDHIHEYLLKEKIIPQYIVLTHEHWDHISSVEYIRGQYKCKLIASRICSESICSPKKNLSVFYDQKGFACLPADIIIEDGYSSFSWDDLMIEFHATPGHSAGGICFSIGEKLFTGDTLMKEYKAFVKLPGGNKDELQRSIDLLFRKYDGDTDVFPGHGYPFKLKEANNLTIND